MSETRRHPKYAMRLIHLNAGWRYCAWERHTGSEVGFDPNGYATEAQAWAAIGERIEADRFLGLSPEASR